MNSFYEMFMESWILWGFLQSKWRPKDFMLTLQETRKIHDSLNIPKNEFIAYIYILLQTI